MTMMKIQNIHARKILAVLLATATVGCTKESAVLVDTEIENIEISKFDKEQSIEFATFADRSTRATATKSDLEFYHNTFKVYGTKTSNEGTKVQPIFQGVTVTAAISDSEDEPNTWEYTTDRYWDKQADNYQFVAFAPAHAPLSYQHNMMEVNDPSALFFSVDNLTIIGQNLQEGAPSTEEKNTGFTGNEGTDCDVMRSAPFKVTDPATTPVVTLNFSHTLSKLLVTLKANAEAPYVITVNNLTVSDLLSTGSYDHNNGWEAKGTNTVDYLYTTPATPLSATEKTYFMESLVIPQTIADTQVLTLNYTITSGSYTEQFTYTATLADLFKDKATAFKAANSYSVNFNIAPEKNIITFDTGVTQWINTDSAIQIE
jgi:hypothetical protein